MEDATKQKIEKDVKGNKVFLYMKGTPESPQCGFSARVVDILKQRGASFSSFNILSDEKIRQGVKEYSDWPTFPQLYINGELIGGCDVVTELDETGELGNLLK